MMSRLTAIRRLRFIREPAFIGDPAFIRTIDLDPGIYSRHGD